MLCYNLYIDSHCNFISFYQHINYCINTIVCHFIYTNISYCIEVSLHDLNHLIVTEFSWYLLYRFNKNWSVKMSFSYIEKEILTWNSYISLELYRHEYVFISWKHIAKILYCFYDCFLVVFVFITINYWNEINK